MTIDLIPFYVNNLIYLISTLLSISRGLFSKIFSGLSINYSWRVLLFTKRFTEKSYSQLKEFLPQNF